MLMTNATLTTWGLPGAENLPWHVSFGFEPGMVATTMVAGKVLMKDCQLAKLDEAEVAGCGRERAKKVWKRYQDKFRT
jgi:hypothetical protein